MPASVASLLGFLFVLFGPIYVQDARAVASIDIEKAINAANPLAPTSAEDADAAPGLILPIGTPIIWTYLVFNSGTEPLTITRIDDAGTPVNTADDFAPAFVSGDNSNGLLDPNEVWLFTSFGVVSATVLAGQYTNVATVIGTGPTGSRVTDTDAANYFGGVGVVPESSSLFLLSAGFFSLVRYLRKL